MASVSWSPLGQWRVAVKRAEIYGIGMVTVNHSNHFGMGATYVLQALEKNMISLVFTNSAKQMPPFGGKETLLGISPFAAGSLGRRQGQDPPCSVVARPFLLDGHLTLMETLPPTRMWL